VRVRKAKKVDDKPQRLLVLIGEYAVRDELVANGEFEGGSVETIETSGLGVRVSETNLPACTSAVVVRV
jgi:hypothetical protein